MNKSILVTVFVASLLGNITFTYAQLNMANWQIGANVGIFIYQGDLTPSRLGSYRTLEPGFGLYISRILSPSFILRTNLARGKLKGNDAAYDKPTWRQQRNFNFTSPVIEISELLVWNILKNNSNEAGRRFSPYLFGGAGVSFLKINRDYSNLNTTFFGDGSDLINGLTTDIAHQLPKKMLILPLGVGVEYYISPAIALTAETNFRYTFTDYLDGFSQAANPARKDSYHSNTLGLVYKFGQKKGLACPEMKY